MKILNVAFVEDNEDDRNNAKDYFKQYEEKTGVKIEVHFFEYAELLLGNYHPNYDAIFFDIELKGMDGLKAARKLRNIDPSVLILFVTNMSQYAIKGYEVNAVDFIIKPISYFSLAMRLDKIQRILESRQVVNVKINLRDGVKLIPVNTIYYLEIMQHDIVFHTSGGEVHAYGNLNEREKELAPFGFARCSACMLVNMRYVNSVNGDELDVNGTILHLSRGKKKQFLQALSDYFVRGAI